MGGSGKNWGAGSDPMVEKRFGPLRGGPAAATVARDQAASFPIPAGRSPSMTFDVIICRLEQDLNKRAI